ncbi:Uncharacterized protein OS=Rhodopirellula europaea 6C GN=RE6C_02743 PE=4 SV=1 [Gemmataceae bacterium]|nr:Uncharacterized protein OS=Rhodopirellula europaea 6C GN=RE6C_02743 PE=4 SV=1 [Gemmataceae bacterium]VTU01459.1 Uncharacterized protein OS=Rhodopirellula europaea 6C GN=RE6C_02743 PE=4 SV=1 [Gemmataceae bacterium]
MKNRVAVLSLFVLASAVAGVALVPSNAALAAPPEGLRWSDSAGLNGPSPSTTPRPGAKAPWVYPQRSMLQVVPMQARTPDAVTLSPIQVPFTRAAAAGEPAYILAHLLPGAEMWIGDVQLITDASKPAYELAVQSLEAGSSYNFTVRVRWGEDGKWVTQAHTFPLRAGEVHCVQLALTESPEMTKKISDSIAKLDAADKKSAEAQKFCAVQDSIRLGAMGTPAKVSVGGKDVFLCCEACKASALKDAEKTLKTIETLKAAKPKEMDKK